MKKIIILLSLLFSTLHSTAFAERTVSDSLVKDLPCSKVSAPEIYRRMSIDQFSSEFHLPFVNWGVPAKNGLYELGVCWSLSRAQRLFFYLSRWNSPAESLRPNTLAVLNMIHGGSSIYPMMLNQEAYLRNDFGILDSLLDGVNITSGSKSVHRNFRSEIEAYELDRFHKVGKNLKYIIGSGGRSKKNNRETRDRLIQNLQNNQLTILVLRANRMAQHVVVAKRFEKTTSGDVRFFVYDSNYPSHDNTFTYRQADSNFYSPSIFNGVIPAKDIDNAIGVYIADEDERLPIEKVLVQHYSSLCRSLTKP